MLPYESSDGTAILLDCEEKESVLGEPAYLVGFARVKLTFLLTRQKVVRMYRIDMGLLQLGPKRDGDTAFPIRLAVAS